MEKRLCAGRVKDGCNGRCWYKTGIRRIMSNSDHCNRWSTGCGSCCAIGFFCFFFGKMYGRIMAVAVGTGGNIVLFAIARRGAAGSIHYATMPIAYYSAILQNKKSNKTYNGSQCAHK